jgi:hypothetical protein
VSVEAIMAAFPPHVQMLAGQVRDLIRTAVPEAQEKALGGWRAIGYTHPTSGYFCAIFPRAEDVRIAFEFGVLLADPDRRLVGSGSQVRYLDLRQLDDETAAVLQTLITAALELPPSRQAKLALIP